MSLFTIIAFISALGIFFGAIATATDNYLMFLSGSSFLIVIFGTIGGNVRLLRSPIRSAVPQTVRSRLLQPVDRPQYPEVGSRPGHPLGLHRPEERPAGAGGRIQEGGARRPVPALRHRHGGQRLYRRRGAGDPAQHHRDDLRPQHGAGQHPEGHGQPSRRPSAWSAPDRSDHHARQDGRRPELSWARAWPSPF